jgi:sialidase-1
MNIILNRPQTGILAFLLLLLLTSFQFKKNITPESEPVIGQAETDMKRIPLFSARSGEDLITIKFPVVAENQPLVLKKVTVTFSPSSNFAGLSNLTVKHSGTFDGIYVSSVFASAFSLSVVTVLPGSVEMGSGTHFLTLGFGLKNNPDLLTSVLVEKVTLSFKNYADIQVTPGKFRYRPAMLLRAAGQDNCDTYRIPGLVTTNKGTLIAVYDNRYNNSKDLQEDIDIGMSRSTDGGQTWEPMKVIMDMGEYGGRSHRLNGCGDPCVLYDTDNNTLWVAALWMSGSSPDQMLWWASKPGIKPEETGQFMLVKSTNDGISWSQAINITAQIKEPEWQLLLQGPGRGITMKNGTLVFPAQFKADIGTKAIDGGQYTCHSTIVYSKDGGQHWQIGTGAKSNTTEAQVVELADGSLMLNMRDDRNRSDKGPTNGRAVATTTDLGKTWTTHPSSNSALPEPNCMASIISADVLVNGKLQQVLFFSNPNNKESRSNMTIKASLDGGITWPDKYQVELNSETGYGYSCMSMVDANTIGILYEGTKELFFQKIAVADILKDLILK